MIGGMRLVSEMVRPEHVLAGGETLIVLGDPERVRELSAEAATG